MKRTKELQITSKYGCGHTRTTIFPYGASKMEVESAHRECAATVCVRCEEEKKKEKKEVFAQ